MGILQSFKEKLIKDKIKYEVVEYEQPIDPTSMESKTQYEDLEAVVITSYKTQKNTLQLPTHIDGKKIRGIGERAFAECDTLKTLTLPESVEMIGENAFYKCLNLASIALPKRMISIGKEAFYNCINLTSIILPEGVTSIGAATFTGCASLRSITIPRSVMLIDEYAFQSCQDLSAVYYCGTVGDFTKVKIYASNSSLYNATLYFYSEFQPASPGRFWHYVLGKPTPW